MSTPIYRPLTPDRQVDLSALDAQAAPPRADRRLADLLPPTPAEPAAAPRSTPVAGRAQIAGAVVACLIVLLAVLYLAQRVPTPAAAPLTRPSAAPAAPSAPPLSAIATAAPARTALARPVGAFAAPDGAYLGIIEAGRPYTPTARLGAAWTQIEAPSSGRVWVRAGELAPDPTLPDLATPTPRPLPTVAPAPVYQPPPPPPTQCARVSGAGITAEDCGTLSLDELQRGAQETWNHFFKGNRVPVVTMTPYGRKP